MLGAGDDGVTRASPGRVGDQAGRQTLIPEAFEHSVVVGRRVRAWSVHSPSYFAKPIAAPEQQPVVAGVAPSGALSDSDPAADFAPAGLGRDQLDQGSAHLRGPDDLAGPAVAQPGSAVRRDLPGAAEP